MFPTDIFEEDDALRIEVELPGVVAEDLRLAVGRRALCIEASRLATGHALRRYHRRERPRGTARREISLPRSVRPEAAEATLRDGVLTLWIPVLPRPLDDAKEIEIRPGGEGRV